MNALPVTLGRSGAPRHPYQRLKSSHHTVTYYVLLLVLAVLGIGSTGCKSIKTNDVNERILPSNFRDWSPEFAVLPYAEIDGDNVSLHSIRNNEYLSNDDFVVDRYDRKFDLNQIKTVDFFVVPFRGYEFMAHTMLSFGLDDGSQIAVSAEIRTEKGEEYSPVAGLTRQYELTYVVADERDVVRLRTRHRNADVYLYQTIATPEQAQKLFLDVMQRVNQLAIRPEFYDTVSNNCTTNIVKHVNRVLPNRVPYGVEVLLPGFSDRYAYDLGLLDRRVPFETLKRRAWINDLADKYYDDPDFSRLIRQRMRANKLDAERSPQPQTAPPAAMPEARPMVGLLDMLPPSGRARR